MIVNMCIKGMNHMGGQLVVRTHHPNMAWFVFDKTQKDSDTGPPSPPPREPLVLPALHAATQPTD